jgi:hypothetical protein
MRGFLPASRRGSRASVASAPIARYSRSGTGRARNKFAMRARNFATRTQSDTTNSQPVCNHALQLCNQLAHRASNKQDGIPALQTACKLVGLLCNQHANLWVLVANLWQSGRAAVCCQLAHCANSMQTVGLVLQTLRILATLCNDLTSLHSWFAYTPTKFAYGSHRALQERNNLAMHSRQARNKLTWRPCHLQTWQQTFCKAGGPRQNFATSLLQFAAGLQCGIRSSHSVRISSRQTCSRLAYCAFGFAFGSHIAQTAAPPNASHMQVRQSRLCPQLAFACRQRNFATSSHSLAILCINLVYVMIAQQNRLDNASSQAKRKIA